MKAKDWQKAAQLVRERQNQAATTDTSELSSFSISELLVDQSGPPALIHRPYVPLSTSMPVHMPTTYGNKEEHTPLNYLCFPCIFPMFMTNFLCVLVHK